MRKNLWVLENKVFANDGRERFLMIDPDEIYEVVDVLNIQAWEGVKPSQVEHFRDALASAVQEEGEDDEEFLNRVVGQEGRTYSHEYVAVKDLDCLIYDHEIKDFCSADDYLTFDAYSFWDGSNFKEFVLDDYATNSYQLELKLGDSYNLDVFDGSNNCWPGKFEHAVLWKLKPSADISTKEAEDMVLLESYTQFQGDHEAGELLDIAEAVEMLREQGHPEIEEIKKWLKK